MPFFRSGVWLLGVILSLTPEAFGRDADPTNDFCSLSEHMLTQKDDMLYIVGGWMLYPEAYKAYNGPNTVLRSVNISKSFQTSLDSVNYVRTDAVPDTIPGVSLSAVFPTDAGFDMSFGRWWPYNKTIFGNRDAPVERRKWQYTVATQQWTNQEMTLQNWFQTDPSVRVSSSMTAWIPSLKKGFLFGGSYYSGNATSPVVTEREEHNGLITYDADTNTWTNSTTPVGGVTGGALVHITTATDEILIQFGGVSGWATSVRPLSDIQIYSTNQSKWYNQKLPSDAAVPAPRFSFCYAVKSASDGSSHQIFMMGGIEAGTGLTNIKGGPATSSTWVLTIPSFEWVQVPFKAKTTSLDPKTRFSPTCEPIGEHYIFYYGGRSVQKYYDLPVCDQKANAVFLLDVNTLTWTDEYVPNQGTYEIPQGVVELIGGDKNGGSTKKAPTKGWSDPDLESIMAMKITARSGAGTNGTGRGNSSPTDSDANPAKTNVAAIAGGAVAAIAAVALGLLAAMFIRRRRHRRENGTPPPGTPKTPPVYNGPLEQGPPSELMAHNQFNGGGVYTVELPAGEVAREMDTPRK